MIFKETDHYYKPDENKSCDECGCPVGPCTEYAGKIRCVGCWADFDCNIRPVKTKNLIDALEEALEEPNRDDLTKVVISYSNAEAILNKLEELEYEKNETTLYVVKKTFGDKVTFLEDSIWWRKHFAKYGFDVQQLLNDGFIEITQKEIIHKKT